MYREKFIQYLKMYHMSVHTIKAYNKCIEKFLLFLKDKYDIDECHANNVTTEMILSFMNLYNHKSDSTFNQCLCILKSFYKWMYTVDKSINYLPTENITNRKVHNKVVKYFTIDDIQHIIDALGKRNKKRNTAIILLGAVCGLRREEIINLDIDKYDAESQCIYFIRKGKEEYEMYLPDSVVHAINAYLSVRPCSDSKALFLSERTNDRMTPNSVNSFLSTVEKKLGLTTGVHVLRHTAATMMYNETGDIYIVKNILGHKNVNTTQRYAHIMNKTEQTALRSNPINKITI